MMNGSLCIAPRASFRIVAATVACALALSVSGTATATVIAPGYDLYQTIPVYPAFPFPSDASNADFSNNPIPAGFFDPGSEPFDGRVIMVGQPIGPGSTDTIVQRLSGLSSGQSGPIPIEI